MRLAPDWPRGRHPAASLVGIPLHTYLPRIGGGMYGGGCPTGAV